MSPPSASIRRRRSSTWALKAGSSTVRSADLTITKSVTLCGPLRRSSMRRSAMTLSGSLRAELALRGEAAAQQPGDAEHRDGDEQPRTRRWCARDGVAAVRASRSVSPAPVLKVFACRAMLEPPGTTAPLPDEKAMGATAAANRPAVVTAGGRRRDMRGGPALSAEVGRGAGVDGAGRGRACGLRAPAVGYPRRGTTPGPGRARCTL